MYVCVQLVIDKQKFDIIYDGILLLKHEPQTRNFTLRWYNQIYAYFSLWSNAQVTLISTMITFNNMMYASMNQLLAHITLLQTLFCRCKKRCGIACESRKSNFYYSAAYCQCIENSRSDTGI